MKNQIEDLETAGLLGYEVTSQNGRVCTKADGAFIDYCSTNYLGFDFHPHMHAVGSAMAKKWGSLSGWSRLELDSSLFIDAEKRIAHNLGCSQVVLSHTITITLLSVMPFLAKKGIIFCDADVHTVVWESARLARDHGCTLVKFKHQDPNHLEELLTQYKDIHPKIIAIDGVYSITTEYASIQAFQTLCKQHDAWLVVDDAHGFGILGRSPTESNPHGSGGYGIMHYGDASFERTFYFSSFGKAFCTHGAFLTIPEAYMDSVRPNCMQYIFSAPPSPYTIGNVLAAMDLNEQQGEANRAQLRRLVKVFIEGLQEMDLVIYNNNMFPVVFWELGDIAILKRVAQALFANGVIAGLRPYPLVPADKCGLRFAVTALHTESQIHETLEIIKRHILNSFKIKRRV